MTRREAKLRPDFKVLPVAALAKTKAIWPTSHPPHTPQFTEVGRASTQSFPTMWRQKGRKMQGRDD